MAPSPQRHTIRDKEVSGVRQRATAPEMMDGVVADLQQLPDSFREVWGVNRYLGGMAVLRRHLRPWLWRGTVTMVDVAAGVGDVAVALAEWARRAYGTEVKAALVDNHPQVLAIARERIGDTPGLCVVAGDARRLPFPSRCFDVGICNLALHHFPDEEAALVLAELERVSRLGWVVADLERHPLAYLSARVLAGAVWPNPITRHDGPLSVQRAYRAHELRQLVERAGVRAAVHRHFPFRLAAVCRKG